MKTLHFLTWCNDTSHLHYKILKLSAKKLGIAITPIGEGETFTDYTCKIDWFFDALQQLPPDDIVLCTDAHDVLYLQNEKQIRDKFIRFDCDILYAAERWPSHQNKSTLQKQQEIYEHIGTNSPYKFLNSGTVIGYAAPLLKMMQTIKTFDPKSIEFCKCLADTACDQSMVSKYVSEHPENIKLDYNAELFWCTAAEWDALTQLAVLDDSGLKNQTTQTYPALIHVPFISQYKTSYLLIAEKIKVVNLKIEKT